MNRAVAVVAVVAIVAVTVLLLALLHRRQVLAREVRTERDQLAVTVHKIRDELAVQSAAGYFDPDPIRLILADLELREHSS